MIAAPGGCAGRPARSRRGTCSSTSGPARLRPTLPAELSRRLVNAAVVAATDLSVPVTVVIVDESGVLRELCRMDDATWKSARSIQSYYP
jgi:Haem-degrading